MVKVHSAIAALLLILPSRAQALTIDDFSGDGIAQAVINSPIAATAVQTSSCIGGVRSMKVQLVSGGPSANIVTFAGALSHSQDSVATGLSWVQWDGDGDPNVFNPNGLGQVSFLQDGGDSVRLIVTFDYAFARSAGVVLTFYSGSVGRSSSYYLKLQKSYLNEEVLIPFAAFTTPGAEGPVDWTKVGAAGMYIDGSSPSVDLTLDMLGTNGRCPQVPTGSGQVVDICGVCGGDGKSCLDCAGVPFGPSVIDACGVCGGDGSSCLPKCSEEDITPMLRTLKKKAQTQRNHNRTLIKEICAGKGPVKVRLDAQAQLTYTKMVSLIAKIPPKVLRCENVTECIKIDTYTQVMAQYDRQAKAQMKLSKQIIRTKQSCNTGGKCTRTAAECAQTQREQDARNNQAQVTGEKLFDDNKTISAKVPCVTYVCPH